MKKKGLLLLQTIGAMVIGLTLFSGVFFYRTLQAAPNFRDYPWTAHRRSPPSADVTSRKSTRRRNLIEGAIKGMMATLDHSGLSPTRAV